MVEIKKFKKGKHEYIKWGDKIKEVKKMKEDKKLEIKVPESSENGLYSNLAFIAHTEEEFILDFIFLQPQKPAGKLVSRIILNPKHAKRFLSALNENIKKYEARFGEIKPNSDADIVRRKYEH